MSSTKRRFRGPAGAVFVPAATVDEETVRRYLESGVWSRVEPESKPDEKPRPVKRSPRKSTN